MACNYSSMPNFNTSWAKLSSKLRHGWVITLKKKYIPLIIHTHFIHFLLGVNPSCLCRKCSIPVTPSARIVELITQHCQDIKNDLSLHDFASMKLIYSWWNLDRSWWQEWLQNLSDVSKKSFIKPHLANHMMIIILYYLLHTVLIIMYIRSNVSS